MVFTKNSFGEDVNEEIVSLEAQLAEVKGLCNEAFGEDANDEIFLIDQSKRQRPKRQPKPARSQMEFRSPQQLQ